MASNLAVMAPNLVVMASNGLQPTTSNGLIMSSDGLQPTPSALPHSPLSCRTIGFMSMFGGPWSPQHLAGWSE